MKKLNKFFAVLVALAMMAMLSVTAFAVEELDTDAKKEGKTETTGKMVKELIVPDGVAHYPTVKNTFTFTTEESALSNVTKIEADKAVPGDAEIIIDGSDALTDAKDDGLSRVDNITIPSLDLTKVDHPGVYAYKVVESNAKILNPTEATGTITPGNEQYIVRYTVVNDGNGGYTIKYVTVQKYDETTKKTTTITDPTKDYDPDTEGVQNDGGFTFTNTYKLSQSGNDYDSAALKITKTVVQKDNDTTKFPMHFVLNKAVGIDAGEAAPAPQYYIYDMTTKTAKGDAKNANYGENTVEIAHNEAIVFLTLPVGTTYTVDEHLDDAAAYSAYLPSVTVNGTAGQTVQLGQTLPAQAENAKLMIEETDKDVVAYTNTYDKNIDTPTGILISNLPYIALALVAIGGLVAYVVVRRRQDDEA